MAAHDPVERVLSIRGMRSEFDRMRLWMDQLMGLWENGAIKPKIAHVFKFDEAAASHHFIQDRKNIGKVLLAP
jgi:NADPH:quinone reductase-like Zn-dependent oxidoreductase